MNKEKFTEILKKYAYPDEVIERLWLNRPSDNLNEAVIRKTAKIFVPLVSRFPQA